VENIEHNCPRSDIFNNFITAIIFISLSVSTFLIYCVTDSSVNSCELASLISLFSLLCFHSSFHLISVSFSIKSSTNSSFLFTNSFSNNSKFSLILNNISSSPDSKCSLFEKLEIFNISETVLLAIFLRKCRLEKEEQFLRFLSILLQ